MASNDATGELHQQQGVLDVPAHHSVKTEPTDDHGSSLSAVDHLPPGNPEAEADTVVKAEARHDEREATMELEAATANVEHEAGNTHEDAAEPQEELPAIASEQIGHNDSQAFHELPQRLSAGILALNAFPAQAPSTDDTIHVTLPTSSADKHSGRDAQSTSIDTEMQIDSVPVDGSGSLGGEMQMVDGQEDVPMSEDMDPHTTDESENEGEAQSGRLQEAGQALRAKRNRENTPDDGDNDDDGSSEESGASDGGDEDVEEEHHDEISALQAKVAAVKAQLALEQSQERNRGGAGSQTRQDSASRQPMMYQEQGRYSGVEHGLMLPPYVLDPRNFDPSYGSSHHSSMQAQQQGLPYKQIFQPQIYQDRSISNSYVQGPMYQPPSTPVMPELYSSPGSGYQQHPSHGRAGYQNAHYSSQAYGDPSLHPGYQQYPVSPFETQARPSAPPSSHRRLQLPQVTPAQRATQLRKRRQDVHPEEAGSTDDDEPLRTRAPRHRSDHEESDMGSPPPAPKSEKKGKKQDKGHEPEVEFVSTKPSMGFKAPKSKKAAPKQPAAPKPPQTPNNPTAQQDASSSPSPINWKLPTYEATFETPKTKDEIPLAKISIPGLVREELLLSPDHVEEETHLLLNVFLPAQQALATPDPNPAVGVLNFHTIAVMVIEAFIQFEIGDEWGQGRGHWHTSHDAGDEEYQRVRNAKGADPDEIFFAVIDRWRAGIESHKEPAKLIRGAQEFCDTALDVVYYIKEHGLLGSERMREEEQRKAKAGVQGKTGIKRGAQKVVGEPRVRKKAKTTTTSGAKTTGAKTPVAKKKKMSTVAVTVTRRK